MSDSKDQASGSRGGGVADWAPTAFVLLAVTVATVSSGGFYDASRFILVMVGSIGLLISAFRAPGRLGAQMSTVPLLSLLGLTLVGGISLLWTDASIGSVILVALTPAAYAGIAIFAGCDPWIRERKTVIGVWLAVLAVSAAVTGLIGVLFEVEPWAFQLGGRSRPAGFVEYPPALALLQLAAMPTLARMLGSGGRLLERVAATSLILGAAVVLLAQSRVVLVLAGLLLTVWMVWPDRTLGVSRRTSVLPISLWIIGGSLLAASTRLFNEWTAVAAAVAILLVLPGVLSRLLPLIKRPNGLGKEKSDLVAGVIIAGALLVAVLVLPNVASPSPEGVQAEQGIDHGRIDLWIDSVPAVREQPFLGHGQGSFLGATVGDQESPMRFAHSLVVESAVELGVTGTLLALLVLLSPMVVAWRLRNDPAAWIYIPAVVGFCALAVVDWTWHLAGIGALWALCLGSILSLQNRTNSSHD